MGILEVAELAPGHLVLRWRDHWWYVDLAREREREPERVQVWAEDDDDE